MITRTETFEAYAHTFTVCFMGDEKTVEDLIAEDLDDGVKTCIFDAISGGVTSGYLDKEEFNGVLIMWSIERNEPENKCSAICLNVMQLLIAIFPDRKGVDDLHRDVCRLGSSFAGYGEIQRKVRHMLAGTSNDYTAYLIPNSQSLSINDETISFQHRYKSGQTSDISSNIEEVYNNHPEAGVLKRSLEQLEEEYNTLDTNYVLKIIKNKRS